MSFAAAFQECASNTGVAASQIPKINPEMDSSRQPGGGKNSMWHGLGRANGRFGGLRGRLVLASYFSFLQ